MKLPEDDSFAEVCSDVVIRFKGHDSYKGRDGALKAFIKRAPDYSAQAYEVAFDSFCQIYNLAIEAIEKFPSATEKKTKCADPKDINFERCMEYLEQVLPGYRRDMKSQILNWVIFWHYLK